jgi:hypothetical protein
MKTDPEGNKLLAVYHLRELIEETPNDKELGKKIREIWNYINTYED